MKMTVVIVAVVSVLWLMMMMMLVVHVAAAENMIDWVVDMVVTADVTSVIVVFWVVAGHIRYETSACWWCACFVLSLSLCRVFELLKKITFWNGSLYPWYCEWTINAMQGSPIYCRFLKSPWLLCILATFGTGRLRKICWQTEKRSCCLSFSTKWEPWWVNGCQNGIGNGGVKRRK